MPIRTLYLLRHAKSCWDDPDLDDHDRPLNERGERSADFMGVFMAKNGMRADFVLCSSAVRTRETWRRVAAAYAEPPTVSYLPALYLAAPGDLMKLLRSADDKAHGLMLIGHNPGMHRLALQLSGKGNRAARERMAAKFPTAALASFTANIDRWRDAQIEDFTLQDVYLPRKLMGTAKD